MMSRRIRLHQNDGVAAAQMHTINDELDKQIFQLLLRITIHRTPMTLGHPSFVITEVLPTKVLASLRCHIRPAAFCSI
jgi:hypothetical protein